jgi:uncharacterized protein
MTLIIDTHVHIGRALQGYEQSVEDLLQNMDHLAITRAILCPVRPIDYAYPPENDFVARVVRDHRGRFWGLGRVDPRRPDCEKETERCLSELGLLGIYLHPWEDTFCIADPLVDRVMRVCVEHRTPVVVATGYPWVSEAPQVAELARRFPAVSIVMTNGGQINISGLGQKNAWLALTDHANTFITTAGVYREDFLEEVLTRISSHRVLFGSLSPIYDQDYELHRVRWAHVSDTIKGDVLWGNAQEVFGLRAPSGGS